ncbi:MAG: ABC transporter substrate-binding protein [Hyphomicrobiaceae bacterium]
MTKTLSFLAAARLLTITLVAALPFVTFATSQAAARKEDAAVKYMRRAANALINAQRKASASAFVNVLNTYGHVPAIALSALGEFRKHLPKSKRRTYYSGTMRFIGRYAAIEATKYPVSRVKFPAAGIRDGRNILVDSKVLMQDGSQYDVRWMLLPNGRGFKVRDAQVLGFWVSPFLQTLFTDYVRENGGNVNALVTVLSRMP